MNNTKLNTSTRLNEVIRKAWMAPFSTKSNYAREHANEVAVAASLGFISTKIDNNTHTNKWLVTVEGLARLHGVKIAKT
jgi:hypothetical protein